MPLIFNPMLPFNFEEKDDIRIFVKDEEGNDVDITEYVATINSKLADKVNTFQGATNGNKVGSGISRLNLKFCFGKRLIGFSRQV